MLTVLRESHPMKSGSFCLGSRAAGVMVGSTGLAIESCHKAEVKEMSKDSCFNIFDNRCHPRSTRRRKAEVLSRRGAG